MTSTTADRLYELLTASLPAWRVAGDVRREVDGGIVVTAGDQTLRITAASPGTPLRWMVATNERTRGAASVVGVLRAVRTVIDPSYAPVRLRIAPSPVVPT